MAIFERLRDYFQGIADAFASGEAGSAVFINPIDKGASREDMLMLFLCQHLPKRCEAIKGGFLFDSSGNESQQIDIMVTNDLTLQFKQFQQHGQLGKSFNCVEGCLSAISVKTMLNKEGLYDSLANLASIPPMPDMSKKLSPLFRIHQERLQDLPFKVVFAFEGMTVETALKHIKDFYEDHNVTEDRKADLIIVNNQYCVIHVGKDERETRDGTKIAPYTYWSSSGSYVGAYSLMYLLIMIQKWSVFGSHIIVSFGDYIDQIPL